MRKTKLGCPSSQLNIDWVVNRRVRISKPSVTGRTGSKKSKRTAKIGQATNRMPT